MARLFLASFGLMVSQIAWLPAAFAQPVPVGPEFQVNTYTTGDQFVPSIASDDAGNFVVVWCSPGSVGSDSDGTSIQGQRYDSVGTPLGAQFQVNTYTTDGQSRPSVAAADAGDFVVVWESSDSADSGSFGTIIQVQRYDSVGTPQGGQFQMDTFFSIFQYYPHVAADAAGNFVVVWNSALSLSDSYLSVQGQRFSSMGVPLGFPFQANTYADRGERSPAVASDAAGNFLVVWDSNAGLSDVHARRYHSGGSPLGDEFQVNTYTTGSQGGPAVAADGEGNFVVLWHGSDAYGGGVFGQRYASSWAPLGGEFQVNTYTTGSQGYPAVACGSAGDFVVTWASDESTGSDTSGISIQAQRFAVPTTTSTSTSTTLPLTDLLPGRVAIIRRNTLVKFVAKPVTGDTFALPAGNPVSEGGSLRIFDTATTAGDNSFTLPLGAAWRGLGSPAGSNGYKYKGAGTIGDPCKVVLVKDRVIKAVCKGAGITLTPPFTGDVGIVLSLGTTDRYCAQFGGDTVKNDATLTKRKNALAPGACP